jgi:hypothetical protein
MADEESLSASIPREYACVLCQLGLPDVFPQLERRSVGTVKGPAPVVQDAEPDGRRQQGILSTETEPQGGVLDKTP